MIKTKYFLSIDWGTTNFRLRMVDYTTLKIAEELSLRNGGVKKLFDQWKKERGSRKSIFFNFLKSQIDKLKIEIPTGTPVIISGMASSSIGIIELPYANLPFNTNGQNAIVRFLDSKGLIDFPVFLVSGIGSEMDAIRGEETQLIGCIGEKMQGPGDRLYIFPGTHSKHILVRDGQVIDFKTYMTGEFFDLLSTRSVLSNSVKEDAKTDVGKIHRSFEKGLRAAINGDLLNEAFYVRTNQLFKKISAQENYYYLSGLLIGTELRNLAPGNYEQIIVVSGSSLHRFYQLAFEMSVFSKKAEMISAEVSDELVVIGHHQLIKNNLKIKW